MRAVVPRLPERPAESSSGTAAEGRAVARRRVRWRRIVLGAAAVVGLVLLVVSDAAHDAFRWAVDAATPLLTGQPVLGAVVFVGLAALSATLAFFSSTVLVPVAIEAWGAGGTAVLLWVGWTLGGVGAYAAARYLGRPVAGYLHAEDLLARYEHQVLRHASFGAVLLFQIAMPSEVPGYALGLARYRLAPFLLALAIAEVPFALLTVYVGASVLERQLPVLLAALVAAALLSGTAYVLVRRFFHPPPRR